MNNFKERSVLFISELTKRLRKSLKSVFVGNQDFSPSRRQFLKEAGASAAFSVLPKPIRKINSNENNVSSEDLDFLVQNEVFVGDESENKVALTYDDHGTVENFEHVLNELDDHDMQATFFLNAWALDQSFIPVLNRIVNEGHEIGCHGFTHNNMTELSMDELENEFILFIQRIQELVPGYKTKYFRAPFGARNPRELQMAAKYGMQSIMWNVVSPGNSVASEKVIEGVAQNGNGSIILGHISRDGDVNEVTEILEYLGSVAKESVCISDVLSNEQIRPSERVKQKSKKKPF